MGKKMKSLLFCVLMVVMAAPSLAQDRFANLGEGSGWACGPVEDPIDYQDLADSIALIYGDNAYMSLVDSADAFDGRLRMLSDSLYLYYMNHPEKPIEHREFVENKLLGKSVNELKVARMEWNLLPEEFHFYGDRWFDFIYQQNYERIHNSLDSLPLDRQRMIRLFILDYERDRLKEERAHYDKSMELQALADTIGAAHPETDAWKMVQVTRRPSRMEHVRKDRLALGAGVFLTHLRDEDGKLKGESLGGKFYLGGKTFIGDFFVYGGGALGYNSGKSFVYKEDKKEKNVRKGSMVGVFDGGMMYRPNIPFGYLWSVQPELSLGFLNSYYFDGMYYGGGVRFERTMQRYYNTLGNPAGFISGWSVGVSAKMSGSNMVGLEADVRWMLH